MSICLCRREDISNFFARFKGISTVASFVILLVLSGCSHQLSRSKVADLLKTAPAFKRPVLLSLSIGGITAAGADVSREKKAESLGYVTVTRGGWYTWHVILTQKGEEAIQSQGWSLGPKANGLPPPQPQRLDISIGQNHVLEVTGIVSEGSNATAQFVWQVDYNDVGKAFGFVSSKQNGQCELVLYDDGWRIEQAGLPAR